MPKATLTSKGQVTIPKLIRDRLGLRAGDRLEFRVEADGTMMVEPLDPEDAPRPLAGFLKDVVDAQTTISVDDMNRGIEKAVGRQYLRAVGAEPGDGG